MAFEGLRQNISELDENVSSYMEHSIEYAKLKSFKISMVLVTYLTKVLLVGIYFWLRNRFAGLNLRWLDNEI